MCSNVSHLKKCHNDVFETISDFYSLGGLSDPVNTLLGSLTDFFNAEDNSKDRDDIQLYKNCNKAYVMEKVFYTCETVKFLVALKDKVDRYEHTKKQCAERNYGQ